MSENMELWNSVAETNPKFTQNTNDGRHSFTAIDAYYRIEKATEKWGAYGGKWKLDQLSISWNTETKLVTLHAVFIYPSGSFPIMNAIKFESNKGSIDDECLKKLQMDTLTKALSFLGFCADVFTGKFDDSRYVESLNQKYGNKPPEPMKKPAVPGGNPVQTQAPAMPKTMTMPSAMPPPMPSVAPMPGMPIPKPGGR